MPPIPKFPANNLQRICDVLADTGAGLTGSEIGRYLEQVGISDIDQKNTKRYRLNSALSAKQDKDGCGNYVVSFIQEVMNPVLYTDNSSCFSSRRDSLNVILVFSGLALREDGKIQASIPAKTLSEAEERTGRLRQELARRNVHPDVLKFCQAELVGTNYFHAIFEATKSVADKIRERSGLREDGASLVDRAFSFRGEIPFLAFNFLQTETEQSEQSGLMNLIKGMFGAFRNVTAHAPRIIWQFSEQDAMDLLTMASYLHRRIDSAIRTPRS